MSSLLLRAIAARADIIVSGDRDLLDLKRHGDIRIVSAAGAVAEIEAKGSAHKRRARREAGR
ncbi:MAG: hypothetical protein IPK27_23200 [Rhodanobacteraceae bacterium]|nr:hypothetical protein [Rhodanobacteraceae bacterium]